MWGLSVKASVPICGLHLRSPEGWLEIRRWRQPPELVVCPIRPVGAVDQRKWRGNGMSRIFRRPCRGAYGLVRTFRWLTPPSNFHWPSGPKAGRAVRRFLIPRSFRHSRASEHPTRIPEELFAAYPDFELVRNTGWHPSDGSLILQKSNRNFCCLLCSVTQSTCAAVVSLGK